VSDPASRLFVALSRINRMLRRDAPALLGQGAVSVLATIVWYGPLRSGDLAAREGVSPPTMTRIVAGLESTGYACRGPDPADGRACLVRATAEGAALINGNSSARLDILRERVDRLPPDHRAALLAALPALDSLAGDD
jgi:DNA-binding MarR family transcriptional regulator